jgi:hypothetical protein
MPRPQYEVDHQEFAHQARVVITVGGTGAIGGCVAGGGSLITTALGFVLFSVVGLVIHRIVVHGTARLVSHAVLADRRGFSGSGYSHIEALEARGDIAGALAAWEDTIRDQPTAFAARLHAADLYVRHQVDVPRAAALFREVRLHVAAPVETQRYASQRLIDLYLGALQSPGKAMAELSRSIEQWPNTRETAGAREALRRLKAEHLTD